MFTSDSEFRETAAALSRFYLPASLLVLLFGFVYEQFSHGVWSAYMVYAFVIPLLFGRLFWHYLSSGESTPRKIPRTPSLFLFAENGAVAALTVGALVRGVLEIYGTTNALTVVYPTVGGMLAVISVLAWFL